VLHQGAGETIEGLAVPLVLQTREGGRTRQVVLWVQGAPLPPELAHGVMAEGIRVMRVCRA
jgi:hypothetical protein